MSDLISRKKIRDYIKGEINPCGKPFEGTAYELGLKMMRYIDAMDSSYYVEKIVEELEELKMRYFLTIANTGDEKSDFAYENVGNALDKAIEIVKKGGVDDDVCEWEYISGGEFIKNPHTKRLYSNEPSMQNVYCNKCGKKIKIVGD